MNISLLSMFLYTVFAAATVPVDDAEFLVCNPDPENFGCEIVSCGDSNEPDCNPDGSLPVPFCFVTETSKNGSTLFECHMDNIHWTGVCHKNGDKTTCRLLDPPTYPGT